jgi:hypothetical protein
VKKKVRKIEEFGGFKSRFETISFFKKLYLFETSFPTTTTSF